MSKERVIRLKAAKALIQAGHTTKSYARNDRGYSTAFDSADATCFCALGAALAVDARANGRLAVSQFTRSSSAYYGLIAVATEGTIVQTNDEIGKEAVLDLYDEAIAAAEANL